MILFGLRDVGSVNVCLPVIAILKDRGIPVSVYAENIAHDLLKNEIVLVTERNIISLLNLIRPFLVVVTPATVTVNGTMPADLTDRAKQKNIPVVLVEDLWSGHSSSEWNVLPDGVCVVDNFAKGLIQKSWPNYPESNIHVTGSPVFDRFVGMQTKSSRSKLRKTLNLDHDWPIIFFAGEVYGMTQAVPMFIEALNGLDMPVYLNLRDHPKVTRPDAPDEFKRIYQEYREALKSFQTGIIVDSSKLTSDEINSGSDIVVGISSTMLVEACYMRKPVLSIWTTEIGQVFFKVTKNTFAEMPTKNLGASLKAESVDEIKICLRKIIAGDTAEMLQAQQKHFQADGLSAERIANVILSYCE